MSRVFQRLLRKGTLFVCAAAASAGLLASSAEAQNNISFGMRPRYNGAPNSNGNVVVYSLPTTGFYAGPVNSTFDLFAQVSGGAAATETASAFGLIATVSGTGQVVFNPPAIVADANNIGGATNPGFASNNSFDLRFANTGVNQPAMGNREIDVIGLEQTPLQNNTITNGDGIAGIPFQVAAGTTGTYTVAFNVSTNYTGFVKTISENNTQFLTNPGAFPHAGGVIEVRASKRGDTNGDGLSNFADIGGFVASIQNRNAFQAANPWLQAAHATDLNESGSTDFADIGAFVAIISGSGSSPTAVPEPSTLALIAMGAIGLVGRCVYRSRKRHNG